MATQPVIAEMSDEQLEQHAFAVLARELGLAGYARFFRLFGSGRGDYTAERPTWQAGLTVESILDAMRNNQTPPK